MQNKGRNEEYPHPPHMKEVFHMRAVKAERHHTNKAKRDERRSGVFAKQEGRRHKNDERAHSKKSGTAFEIVRRLHNKTERRYRDNQYQIYIAIKALFYCGRHCVD